ncbi:hypothetical protein UXP41_21035 [Enterobacter hormaechei]|jgi:phage shock protein A|uniref:Uncharacterized protein n=3 Tax=Enterobacteriaceae TaxID=543 RepID=A7MG15_CROS8|nr:MULTISPECIES: hypothetical protein [Enterobacterales]EIV3800928.1 hypothetical protein [Klebsiella aerogenes]EKT9521222.1 hypothetical protein [Raoultella ornithinolytica]ELE9265546.1 hypothetical protein [Enterobacter kobei]HBQ0806743.1 hypothetical protein [Klebsiella pneumoniae]HDR2757033.1 hypothetical protein [Enterobacter mori]HDW0669591.1 hypothetical protein [Enterobacter cloacae]HEM8744788.1 hypothetical protein [Enterobacter sichuanensis]
MDIGTLFALVISGLGVLYSIFRDNTKDTTDLLSRVSYLETTIAVQDSNITRLSDEQDKMKETLRNLEIQIHELDIKLERIITILEQSKQ